MSAEFKDWAQTANAVLGEVLAERILQIDKYPTSHDDAHYHEHLLFHASARLNRAGTDIFHGRVADARERLLEAAALVVAEIEKLDRETNA